MRRSRSQLEKAIVEATGSGELAAAHYQLALFHDNNSREAEAIPHYRQAIELGLNRSDEASARAWLASSLHKTGSPTRALQELEKSRLLSQDASLSRFLNGLEQRIKRSRAP